MNISRVCYRTRLFHMYVVPEMQNSKCKVQNYAIASGNILNFISEADTLILHFAFCTLHSDS